MTKSMTGFGKSECELADRKFTVEIRSLNSRQLDITIKLPGIYRDRETILRNDISARLCRGKIDVTVYIDHTGIEHIPIINIGAVKHYVEQLSNTGKEIGIGTVDKLEMMKMAMRMPETLTNNRLQPDEKEWGSVYQSFLSALEQVDRFRTQEGMAIHKDIMNRIDRIEELLGEIARFEEDRISVIRRRIQQNLSEFIGNSNVDRNRFEQEVIYYIEKLDISEEKVRLRNHVEYFRETMSTEEQSGRKLAFISQEIGREINTLGSKANDHNIQKLVIQMKDELEKIKEQTLNIL